MNGNNNCKKLKVNGELSCAAADLLVKPVRVGVSLGDLLTKKGAEAEIRATKTTPDFKTQLGNDCKKDVTQPKHKNKKTAKPK